MIGMCKECNKYNNCSDLCATAESYVNKDHVSRYKMLDTKNNMLFPEGSEPRWHGNPTLDYLPWENCASWEREIRSASIDLSFIGNKVMRKCLTLFYLEERKVRVIASLLNIKINTVTAYLVSGRREIVKKFMT